MHNISPEVLIYIQTVRNYFETNKEAKEFFLSNSDEKLFYEHLIEIAQKNFDKKRIYGLWYQLIYFARRCLFIGTTFLLSSEKYQST